MSSSRGLLTSSDHGLALCCRSPAGPCHPFRDGSTGATRRPWPATSRGTTKYTKPQPPVSGWGWRGRHPADAVRVARVAPCRPYPHQQLVAQQDGQWHTKATWKRRSLHNAGPVNRAGDSSNRVLVVRQLLVTGARRANDNRGLTNAETAPESCRPHQCGECGGFLKHDFFVVVFDDEQQQQPQRFFKPHRLASTAASAKHQQRRRGRPNWWWRRRQSRLRRLAPRRSQRPRHPLTSRPLREQQRTTFAAGQ